MLGARASQKCKTARRVSLELPPPPPSITIPFPSRLRLDLKRANLSSTTRSRVFHRPCTLLLRTKLCDRGTCTCGHGGPHLNLKSALHNARPRRCTSTPGPPNCGLVRVPSTPTAAILEKPAPSAHYPSRSLPPL